MAQTTKATTTKAAAPKATKPAAAKAAPKAAATPATTRAVFGPDQCHHRNAKGAPDCNETRQKGRNLCPTHEKAWQIAAKARRAERQASGTPAPNAPKATPSSAGTSKATAGVKRATRSDTKGRVTQPKREPIAHGAENAKPHPMSVLRAPVQRQPSPDAELVAPRRARQAK